MDRTVNLEAVLKTGGGRADGTTERRTEVSPKPVAPTVREQSAGSSLRPATPSVIPSVRPPVQAPEFTLAGIQAIWPEVVEAGRAESRFLADALAACSIVRADAGSLVVRLPAEQSHMLQPIERGRRAVEAFLQVRLGVPVTLTVETNGVQAAGEKPRRMSEASLKSERLRGLRGADPALDTAVDELDLEIVDERPPSGGR
jgi:hypothetical protein